jgi:hypothetical protein
VFVFIEVGRLFRVHLHRLKDSRLDKVSITSNFTTLGDLAGTTMELKKLSHIETWLLKNLHLADESVVERVDGLASLLNIFVNFVSRKTLDNVNKITAGDFTLNDLTHLCTDVLDLGGLGVAALASRVGLFLSETDAEDTKDVTISCLSINKALDECLPLLYKTAELVSGEGHAVEVKEKITTRDFLAYKTELAEGALRVHISLIDFEDTATKTISSELGTLSTGNKGLAEVTLAKVSRSLDVIPLLLGEHIHHFFLGSLLEFLALADCHFDG